MAYSMLHLAYKNAAGGGVPSPVDGNGINIWPVDYWAGKVFPRIKGPFGAVLFPPLAKGSGLGGGWDPFDYHDLGSKPQRGRVETRYADIERKRRAVAIANRNGMLAGLNFVFHHLDGDKGDCVYQYWSATDPKGGRFPFDRNCFWLGPGPNPDGVFNPTTDWSFGRELRWFYGSYGDGQGEHGHQYVMHAILDAYLNQTLRLGISQSFFDDIKGMPPTFIQWLVTNARKNKYFAELNTYNFGELYDSNPSVLGSWVYQCQGTCGVLDFSDRMEKRNWCNNPGSYDMRNLANAGYYHYDPDHDVNFYEDVDTDESGPIFQRMLQAAAYTGMVGGYPMHFGKAMYAPNDGQPDCYGMMDPIVNIAWCGAKFANGPILFPVREPRHLVVERPWAPGAVAGFSNHDGDRKNPNDWFSFRFRSHWWPGTHIKEYTGASSEIRTVDQDQFVEIPIPPTDGKGRGYCIWSQVEQDGPIHIDPIWTKQFFIGGPTHDVGPVLPEKTDEVGAIWTDPEYSITINLVDVPAGLTFAVIDPSNTELPATETTDAHIKFAVWTRGRHMITATNEGTDAAAYQIQVRYMGMTHLTEEEMIDPRVVTHEVTTHED